MNITQIELFMCFDHGMALAQLGESLPVEAQCLVCVQSSAAVSHVQTSNNDIAISLSSLSMKCAINCASVASDAQEHACQLAASKCRVQNWKQTMT